MDQGFRFYLDQASAAAWRIDLLYYFLWAVTAFFSILIFGLIIFLSVKYRRRSEDERPRPTIESLRLELFYTFVPFAIAMVIFFWGAREFFLVYGEPKNPMNIHVVGKQWMWKLQHPDGKREINELHVPTGREIQLTMASQDVIHSFFIPAFRVKTDVLPERYTRMSFTPTKVGTYHLFCAEYCGTNHSRMIGRVVVQTPEDYQAWLRGTSPDDAPAVAGGKLFAQLGCITCHGPHAPSMAGLYLSERRVSRTIGGEIETVRADEQYLRESILNSTAMIVEGYQPVMPSYRGQITEDQLSHLIAYIRSVRDRQELRSGEVPAAPEQFRYGGDAGRR